MEVGQHQNHVIVTRLKSYCQFYVVNYNANLVSLKSNGKGITKSETMYHVWFIAGLENFICLQQCWTSSAHTLDLYDPNFHEVMYIMLYLCL